MATKLTKSDINSFLDEIQHKARVSINEKDDRLLSEESARLIQENDISSDIEKLAKLIHETQEVVCRLNKAIDKINGYPRVEKIKHIEKEEPNLQITASKDDLFPCLKGEKQEKKGV